MKWAPSACTSLRSTSTATLTTANTASSSSDVVPPSVEMAESFANAVTYRMSPKAIVVVNKIATHGVRRDGCTVPSTGGSTCCLAIP